MFNIPSLAPHVSFYLILSLSPLKVATIISLLLNEFASYIYLSIITNKRKIEVGQICKILRLSVSYKMSCLKNNVIWLTF